MEERGVSGTEVRKAVREGIVVPARRGRKKHPLAFPFERYWLSGLYRSRLVDVYSIEEGDAMIVLTGAAGYFYETGAMDISYDPRYNKN